MDKSCKIHGDFHTLIWADSGKNYTEWLEYGGLPVEKLPRTSVEAFTRLGTYEHPQCSFMACYYKAGKQFKSLMRFTKQSRTSEDYKRIRQSVKKTWLPSNHQMLTVGGMAFQDAWNIDLMRVMNCSIHIIGRDGVTVKYF